MPLGTRTFHRAIWLALLMVPLSVANSAAALQVSEDDYFLKLLGKFVFFDNISSPSVQSCASCHAPRTGGTGNSSIINRTQVAENGASPHAVGSLKAPTNTYATLIPPFVTGGGPNGNRGGNFWNGRSVGAGGEQQITPEGVVTSTHIITDTVIPAALVAAYQAYLGPTADQALNPFPNDLEQNVPVSLAEASGAGLRGAEAVCGHVKSSKYAFLYEYAWGEPINCASDDAPRSADVSFQRIAIALSAYQASSEVNSFSSKRDIALRVELACAEGWAGEFAAFYNPWICEAKDQALWGKFPLIGFTDEENFGHDLFYGLTSELNPTGKDAACTECHVSRPDVGRIEIRQDRNGNPVEVLVPDGTALDERYTNDSFHNIGAPWNPQITNPECTPEDDTCFEGLAGHLFAIGRNGSRSGVGQRKVPTLRNVDKRPNKNFVKAYSANGWFKSLESIIHFYNTANVDVNCVITEEEDCTGRGENAAEELTATAFGITRCEDRAQGWTEAQALAANCWPRAEFFATPISPNVGNLGLSAVEEAALVTYMKTLTDWVTASPPRQSDLRLAQLIHAAQSL